MTEEREMVGGVDVRRATTRFVTQTDWLVSRHSFSFGPHYDPGNVGFGLLTVHNEDVVSPRAGFEWHEHRDAEILTWVLDGVLTHEDSSGHRGEIRPGMVQRLSAGSGVRHTERYEGDAPVHFVQMWVRPEESGGRPGYAQTDMRDPLDRGGWVTVASGRPTDAAALASRLRTADMHVARLHTGATLMTPDAPYVHLFVARGRVEVADVGALGPGDAARMTSARPHRLTSERAEVIAWAMDSAD